MFSTSHYLFLSLAVLSSPRWENNGGATRSSSLAFTINHTNLQVHTVEQGGGGRSAPFWAWMAKHTGMPADKGALPQLRAATDPTAKGGEFYGPRWVNNGAPVRKPILRRDIDKGIERLWLVSERETGAKLDFDAAMETS